MVQSTLKKIAHFPLSQVFLPACGSLQKRHSHQINPWVIIGYKKNYGFLEPGAWVTIFTASTISGSISAGIPMTISSSAIPENFRDPSQPREKFGLPERTVWATESEQTDWIPENEACIRPPIRNNDDCASFSIDHGLVIIIITCGTNGVFSKGAYRVA